MARIDEILNRVDEAIERKRKGLVNSILWDIPTLGKNDFPGWVKGKYYGITALPSQGKTALTKYLVLYNTYKHWISHNRSFDFEIFWFALEESEEDFWDSIACMALFIESGTKVRLFPTLMNGRSERTITAFEREQLEKVRKSEFFNLIESRVHFISNIWNPTGIYKHIKKHFENPELGEEKFDAQGRFVKYIHRNPEKYYFIVTDHISNFEQERDDGEKLTHHATLGLYSKRYVLGKFSRKYDMVCVNIHQQDAQKAKREYYQGQVIEESLLPSEDHLANNKEIQRDYDVLIGLYDPYSHGMDTTFNINYRLPKLRDGRAFRWLTINKDRLSGLVGTLVPLYFEGSVFYFEQLPNYRQIRDGVDELANYPKYTWLHQ